MATLVGSVDHITKRRQEVLSRWDEFKTLAKQRRAQLEDSRRLQHFNRDVDELEVVLSPLGCGGIPGKVLMAPWAPLDLRPGSMQS